MATINQNQPVAPAVRPKTHFIILLDRSSSMDNIIDPVIKAFNDQVAVVREQALSQDISVSLITFASHVDSPTYFAAMPAAMKPLSRHDYRPNGMTALFDAVGDGITRLQALPDANDPNTSFLVIAITDGGENQSFQYNASRLNALMNQVQMIDHRLPLPASRWTLAFLVPPHAKENFCRQFQVSPGNVREWEATRHGMEQASVATQSAMRSYFTGRASGQASTGKFYADMTNVSTADVQKNLVDVSTQVHIWTVPTHKHEIQVRDFCEQQSSRAFLRGAAFYELVKSEKEVQDYKQILIRDKNTGAVYGGDSARQLLSLGNAYGTIRLAPGYLGKWDVFIQSTSTNRKLPAGSRVIYCPLIGTPFLEGKSVGGIVAPLPQPVAAVVPFPVAQVLPMSQPHVNAMHHKGPTPVYAAKKVHNLVQPVKKVKSLARKCHGNCGMRRVLNQHDLCTQCA